MNEELAFPTELKLWKYKLERIAKRFGLDFDQVMYVLVNAQEMSEIAARSGFPNTPHHWQYGQDSLQNKKRFRYGLGRIYEMVVNTRPNYAYLLQLNDLVTQKAVMAHVCGHVDFFKNSAYFVGTNTEMVNAMAADALRVDRYAELYGRDRVEQFYDWVLSFEHFIDINAQYRPKKFKKQNEQERVQELTDKKIPKLIEPREPLADYMDEFLNPQEWIESERERLAKEVQEQLDAERGLKVPPRPMLDILAFLATYAPLEDWQRDIVIMIRRHWQYFAPQARTKIMNEGWATVWEEEIMTEAGVLPSSELVQFADELAGITRKGRGLNPYRLGYELWKDIKFRWDTGRHGEIWERCEHLEVKNRWDEFIIYKTLGDESGYDSDAFRVQWREFSCYLTDLKEGRLAFPKEFFKRNLFTSEYVVPLWVRYRNLDAEYKRFSDMLEKMQPLELQASLLAGKLAPEKPHLSEEELRLKARRDVYAEAGQNDLWPWTIDEVSRELTLLEALRSFRGRFQADNALRPEIPIPHEWRYWAQQHPDTVRLGQGLQKMFEVRSTHDDVMFLEEFFTQEFCETQGYFLYKAREVWNWQTYDMESRYVIDTRSFRRIKRRLIWQYTNFCIPIIEVVDANWENSGAVHLVHRHEGVDLDFWSKESRYMLDVLQRFFHVMGGKNWVYLETVSTDEDEDEPVWFNWHDTPEKATDEDVDLVGYKIIFGYGLDEEGHEKFTVAELEDEIILFKSPF